MSFFEFLWEGPAKIKYNAVVKQHYEGGLNMINLKTLINSMKVTLLRRVINHTALGNLSYIHKTLSIFMTYLLSEKSYTGHLLKDIKNQFWVDVLKAYAEVLKLHKLDSEDLVLSNSILYNHSINIGDKPVFIKNWYKNKDLKDTLLRRFLSVRIEIDQL